MVEKARGQVGSELTKAAAIVRVEGIFYAYASNEKRTITKKKPSTHTHT